MTTLDPEPPPEPLGLRLRKAAIGLAVVAAGVGLSAWVLATVHSGGSDALRTNAKAGDPASGGQVVYWSAKWTAVGVAGPDGTLQGQLSVTLSDPGGGISGSVSPDGRTLLLGTGDAFDLNGAFAQQPHATLAPSLLQTASLIKQPWADHGRKLLLFRQDCSVPLACRSQLILADVATGEVTPLAFVSYPSFPQGNPVFLFERVAADPLGPGAVVTAVAASGYDSELELVSVGKGAVPLLSGAEFGKQLGFPAGQPIALGLIGFSPNGQLLAVYGWQIGPDASAPTPSGVVLIDRTGRIVGSLKQGHLQTTSLTALWAGDQRLIMWVGAFAHPAALIWDISGQPRAVPAPPDARALYSPECTAAPDTRHVLCGDSGTWVDIDVVAGRVASFDNVPGTPLAWVVGPSR